MANEPKAAKPNKVLPFLGVLFSILYLMNLSGGLFEIPDNLPIAGNIDEVLVSYLLFYCLKKLNISSPKPK